MISQAKWNACSTHERWGILMGCLHGTDSMFIAGELIAFFELSECSGPENNGSFKSVSPGDSLLPEDFSGPLLALEKSNRKRRRRGAKGCHSVAHVCRFSPIFVILFWFLLLLEPPLPLSEYLAAFVDLFELVSALDKLVYAMRAPGGGVERVQQG